MVEGQFDRDRAAQGVADQHATLDVQGVEQTVQRCNKEVQGIEGVGFVRSAVARQVRDDHPVTGLGEHRVVLLEVAVTAGARPAAMDENHGFAVAGVMPADVFVVQLQTIRQRNEVPLR
ncbi:hypothetical protein D3C78_1662590 [compost metagenome]